MSATRSVTILNETGDKTLIWSDEDDDEMEAIIERKMAAGEAFVVGDTVYVHPEVARTLYAKLREEPL